MFGLLHMLSIAISDDTKILITGGGTAEVQLAIWTEAGLTRPRQMLANNKLEAVSIPTQPTLSAHGHNVYLTAF